jgi:hypothetical protein
LGARWIDFFETNNKKIVNGFSKFSTILRAAFVNDLSNSFALVSNNLPPLGKATVELCTPSDDFYAYAQKLIPYSPSKRNSLYNDDLA